MTVRNTLPQRRYAETFEMEHGGQRTRFAVTVGYYDGREIGEVFITGGQRRRGGGARRRGAAVDCPATWCAARHHQAREQDGSPSTIIGAVVDRLTGSE
jgi:hypothetical protein